MLADPRGLWYTRRMRCALLPLAFLATLGCECGGEAPVRIPEPMAAPATPALLERARLVHDRFDPERARSVVALADRYFRVRGNLGYVRTLERVREDLTEQGFTALAMPALGPVERTWTPRSATLETIGPEGPRTLVHFDDESGVDRAALYVRSDSTGPLELEVVTRDAVRAGASARGKVVLAEGNPQTMFGELVTRGGAIGLLTRFLEPYHQTDRHPDMAQFGYLPEHEGSAFGFSLSEQDYAAMQGVTRVRVHVDVATGSSAALAVDARIVGTDPAAGAIVVVTHVDEPGANDNGSGVGAMTELARTLHSLIEEGAIPRPRRTIVFLWGQEIEVSSRWLADPPIPVAAGLVLDMVGEDPAIVGAPFLIERMPDPGAVWLREPDRHTEWGSRQVSVDRLHGHFLNDLVAACASAVESFDGPWAFRTNPFEGGSDHEPFLDEGLPAVLGWHFTDGAYHTTVDRLDRVSGEEMRRVAATFGAAALTMANDEATELIPIVEHAGRERLIETDAAGRALIESGRSDAPTEQRVLRAWRTWYDEAFASIGTWTGLDVTSARTQWTR